MKAAVLNDNNFIIKDIEKPILEEKGAIIKIYGCGLCGSDIVKIRMGVAKNGAVLGHEVVGEIIEIDSNTNFEIGDRVALGHHIPCFSCEYCWDESYSMCEHFKKTNIFPGGFAEYIFVSEEHLKNTTFKIDDDLTDIEASFLEPLSCCIRAIKRANLKDNSKSLVIGLGSIGIIMGAGIKAFRHKVYGCDILKERVELSKNYGFDDSFTIENENNFIEQIKKIAPLGFDRIFLTAGSDKALNIAQKAIRLGGTIIVFSSIKTQDGFTNNDIYFKEYTIMGSYSPSPMDLEDSMKLIENKLVKVDGLSTEYNIEDLNKAIEDTLSNKIMKAYIKL